MHTGFAMLCFCLLRSVPCNQKKHPTQEAAVWFNRSFPFSLVLLSEDVHPLQRQKHIFLDPADLLKVSSTFSSALSIT